MSVKWLRLRVCPFAFSPAAHLLLPSSLPLALCSASPSFPGALSSAKLGGSVCWLTALLCFQASLRLLFLASHLWHTGLYSCCLRVFLHSFCSCFYSPVLPSSSQSRLSVFSRVTVPVLFHSYSGLLHTLYMFGSLWVPCSCELGSYCLHVTGSQYERTQDNQPQSLEGTQVWLQGHSLSSAPSSLWSPVWCVYLSALLFQLSLFSFESFTHVYSEVWLAFKSCLLIK